MRAAAIIGSSIGFVGIMLLALAYLLLLAVRLWAYLKLKREAKRSRQRIELFKKALRDAVGDEKLIVVEGVEHPGSPIRVFGISKRP